jgi:hypothetical protein
MIGLVVMAAGLRLWHRRQGQGATGGPASSRAWVPVVISVLAGVVALGTSVQIVLIGHSGAKAAWSGVASTSGGSASTDR